MEYQMCLEINFIDFKKAIDSVHHHSLWKTANLYGIPDCFINSFRALYDNIQCCIKMLTRATSILNITIFVPFLLLLVINSVMNRSTGNEGLNSDLSGRCISDRGFVDGIALMANDCVTYRT